MSYSKLAVGIVGLPNVGKSTLFKALTKKSVLIANYPFATIDPNVGVVEVPDTRLSELARVSKSEKIIPTAIEFYDIAGLVRGASKGEGLGNQFLAHIREVDAVAEVVRVFSDPNVVHIATGGPSPQSSPAGRGGSPEIPSPSGRGEGEGRVVDPHRDIDIISIELAMSDLKTVEKRLNDISGEAKSGNKEALKLREVLEKIKGGLNEGKWARGVLNGEEHTAVRDLHLLTIKPVLYVYNVDESQNPHPALSPRERGWGEGQIDPSLPGPRVLISAKIESELADLSADEAKAMMQDLGLAESGLDQLIHASYKLLGLVTFFTSGPKETRAWTVPKGTKAPQAAGVIHSDFEKAFIRAEIINWKDFVDAQGEAGAKEKGRLRIEGKDYTMQDGDVVHFRVTV